ncbi:MAG: GntR family transcriptional regulator [Arenicellales bacterium]
MTVTREPVVAIKSEIDRQDTTRRAKAQDLIRSAILNGYFSTGQKLVERELCKLTGASRSILREALVKLEASGLIERQSYRGYRVATLNVQKVCEIFELRAALETLAAELFTERASPEETAALNQAYSNLEQCITAFDLNRTRAAKQQYYDVLFSGCRNVEIRRALENIIDRIYYLRSRLMQDPNRRMASLEEMRRLTEALIKRDRVAARAASIAHLEAARGAVLLRMAQDEVDSKAKTTSTAI